MAEKKPKAGNNRKVLSLKEVLRMIEIGSSGDTFRPGILGLHMDKVELLVHAEFYQALATSLAVLAGRILPKLPKEDASVDEWLEWRDKYHKQTSMKITYKVLSELSNYAEGTFRQRGRLRKLQGE